MAEDSDGSGESLTTVVTCEGNLHDPEFPAKLDMLLDKLRKLVCESENRHQVHVRKLEPWNSVRVTLAIPREAALRLRQLASEGSQQLRALGILSVQVEGDQVISLRLAGRFGQEPQEIVLRSEPPSEPQPGHSGLSIASNQTVPSTSTQAPVADKVQFRSPNVVCPTDTQVPKVPVPVQSSSGSYNGPFPFASMTHAAQAIHNRETPYTQPPPPPYPSKTPLAAPNVALSSPLLVTLLQNDGAPAQTKPVAASVATPGPSTVDSAPPNTTNSPCVKYPNSAVPTAVMAARMPPLSQKVNTQVPVRGALPSPLPLQPPQLMQNVRGTRPALPVSPQHKFGPQPSATMTVANVQFGIGAQYQRHGFKPQPPAAVPLGSLQQQVVQQSVGPQQQQSQSQVQSQPQVKFQQSFQQFPSPPPYPRQRIETVRPPYQDAMRYPQASAAAVQPVPTPAIPRIQQQATSWQQPTQFPVPESTPAPIGQPMASMTPINTITQLNHAHTQSNLQPIAQPMPHLGSLNPIIENTLLNIPPSLTDLSKTDLDSLLPGTEIEEDNHAGLLDVPESLTSSGKKRQYLINPLTGVLEPMPSESSGSDTEPDDVKDDIFNDLNSPLNDRSNSIYSDEDTCSTPLSRKFDTPDQSDSEATVRSTNSDNSVKSRHRLKSTKNRERNHDSPGLKKSNKDLQPEKIKLRLKLEKSEPVTPAYKVDVSYMNTQQPKRAIQNVVRPSTVPSSPCPTSEELRVPPLHISLRGRNSVVINSEEKKKKYKLNPDGTIVDVKKSKKIIDGLKVKKSFSAKELSLKSSNNTLLTSGLSQSESSLNQKTLLAMKANDQILSDSSILEHVVEKTTEMKLKTESMVKTDIDDVPLNCRTKESDDIKIDLKKSKKLNKLNHLDLYREKNLLTGGHLVDEHKLVKKVQRPDVHNKLTSEHGRMNSHFKKERLKDRSDSIKGLKRHAETNGLLHMEKKRKLSQSEGKSATMPAVTESHGAIKPVKLKPSEEVVLANVMQNPGILHHTVVGSTNVGTISTITNKNILKSSDNKSQKPINKLRRDKGKDGTGLKTKDLNRDKTYSQNVAEKLAKQLPLPIGEIDMEAKFKQVLESSEMSRRHLPMDRGKLEQQKCDADSVTDIVQITDVKVIEFKDTRQDCKSIEPSGCKTTDVEKLPAHTNVNVETELPQSQRIDDKQSGRSPNSGGQGEDSGIESMDALSEKSPNQASQSPHSHTDITLTDTSDMKPVKSEVKLEGRIPDLMDIEAQLAKMDGLPTLNGDLSRIIKSEPFMKTETLIEKLEGKDLNENKEHVKEIVLDQCCSTGPIDSKVQNDCKLNLSDLPLNAAMQESLKQGSISVTAARVTSESSAAEKRQPDVEISLVPCKYKSEESKSSEVKHPTDVKDLDFDPLPIRRKPPLYTYSNSEKQSRDSESPIPNLSDMESDNSDSNSECSEVKPKLSQKTTAMIRRRKQNLDNIPMNDNEMEACMEAMDSGHFLTELTGFKKNDVAKKASKSLLEQLLIEIPNEISEKQVSSTSPSVSEKSLNTSKSSIRTRSSSKLNSPDISEPSKCDKTLKTPKLSPAIKQDSPVNSPVLCPKTSPKIKTLGVPVKRKRQESESSTQSNVSLDEANVARNKKARKCSENAVELIKACMGVEHDPKNIPLKTNILKDGKKLERNKVNSAGLLRKSQMVDVESSDSDEPLIEIAGKVRSKHVMTRNKLTIKGTMATPPVLAKVPSLGEEKMGTRRSVRNNASVVVPLKTRSKLGDKVIEKAAGLMTADGDAQMRRKTRSAVSEDVKRRRNSRDGK